MSEHLKDVLGAATIRTLLYARVCAGVSDEFLEAVAASGGISELEAEKHKWMVSVGICERQVNELAEIKEELLAGLKEALEWNWLDDDPPSDVWERLQAIIAKAEQK